MMSRNNVLSGSAEYGVYAIRGFGVLFREIVRIFTILFSRRK